MPREGYDFGTDLGDLEYAGKFLLPHIGEQFGAAKSLLGRVNATDGAFARPAELGGGNGTAQPAFLSVRDTLSKVLQDAQDNLDLTGQALAQTAQEYLAADDSAAGRIKAGYADEMTSMPTIPSAGN